MSSAPAIRMTLEEPPGGDLEHAILAGARGILEDVALALDAWRLKLADQFDELLCLARVKDVRRLDHQVETVHRVLRAFCGRALLADEVGLGKTIERGCSSRSTCFAEWRGPSSFSAPPRSWGSGRRSS